MPTRPGLTAERIVDEAARVVDEEGQDSLTLGRLARKLGVKTPSLYNHVNGLEGLRHALRLRALQALGAKLQRAAIGRSGRGALLAVADAYREYARSNPGLYALTQVDAGEGGEELRSAEWLVVEVVLAVLRGYGLTGDEAIHGARLFRSALHGFVSLETNDGFGLEVDLDETFERLTEVVHQGLASRQAEVP